LVAPLSPPPPPQQQQQLNPEKFAVPLRVRRPLNPEEDED
jgi:hypothetical protein